jgi:hypothetical protein
MHRTIPAVAALLVTGSAHAYEADTVRSMLPLCRSALSTAPSPASAGCGYVVKTLHTVANTLPDTSRFCPPMDVTVQQLIGSVVSYLEKMPNTANFSFNVAALAALHVTYPCKR